MTYILERGYAVKQCANPDCTETFSPTHPSAKYHDVECHAAARGRTGKAGPKNCENPHCNKPLVRGRRGGKPEPALAFFERRFCDARCADSLRSNANPYLVEDVEWIIGTDLPERIATRVGYATVDNLATALAKRGREDLALRLRAAHVEHLEAVGA